MHLRLLIISALLFTFLNTANAQRRRRATVNCHKNTSAQCVNSKTMALPADINEFLKRRATMGKNVWDAATLVVHALMKRLYDKEAGGKMLLLMTTESNLRKNARRGPTYKGWGFHARRLEGLRRADEKPHCMRAFATGTRHTSGYKVDPKSVTIRFRRQDAYSGSIAKGRYRVFVCSTGADSCKALWMTRNPRGIWKADQWGFIVGGCRRPRKKHDAVDDL